MLAFKLQNYNQQLLLFGGDFAIGKLRGSVSFVAHYLNLQELKILAFRSAFDRKGNRSSISKNLQRARLATVNSLDQANNPR